MHGGSGLNFQQGHFTDPLASVQASLGAGSMFAKTLSNMQQFDQDEAKLQMMRQDRERQAKLDAEREADRKLAADEKKKISGAMDAVLAPSGPTTDFMNETFANMQKKGGAEFENVLLNKDGKHKAESDKLQQSLSDFSDQQSIGEKANSLYQGTDLSRLSGYVDSIGGLANAPLQVKEQMKALSDANKLAKANLFKDQQAAELAYANATDAASRADAMTRIEMAKTQLSAIDNPSERSEMKDLARELKGTSSGSKKEWDPEFSKIAASYKAKYASAPEDFKVALSQTIENARKNKVIPERLSEYLSGVQDQMKKGDKDEFDTYKFKTGNQELLKKDDALYGRIYGGSNASGTSSEMSAIYDNNKKLRDQAMAELLTAQAGKLGENDVAVTAAKKKLDMLMRTEGEVLHDDKMNMAQAFLKDNFSGYKHESSTPKADAVKVKFGNASSASTIDGSTAAKVSDNIKAFQLDPKYNEMDSAGRTKSLTNSTISLIRKEEGTGSNGRYVPYMDKQIDKNGKVISEEPTLGSGIHMNEFLAATPSLHGKFNPNSASDRKAFDTYEAKRLKDTVAIGTSQAAALGLPAESIPLLSSLSHQAGRGWMEKWPNMVAQIKSGDYDGAIKTVDNSLWHKKQTPERAEKFIAMLSAVKEMKAAKGEKWNYAPDNKYDSYLSNKVAVASKNPIVVSTPQNLQNPYRENISNASSHDYRSYLTPQESAKISDPNTRFIDRWSIESDAKSRMGIHEVQDKARAIQMDARNEQLSGDIVAKHGLALQYKNAKTESQRKLIENTAKLMEADQENAERGAALKAGLFH